MKLPFSFKFEWNTKLLIQRTGVVCSFYFAILLPTFFLLISIKGKNDRYNHLSEEVEGMGVRMERVLEIQKDRTTFFKKYSGADHYYLDHVLEATTFLNPEVEALELVYGHPAFESCDNIKRRLAVLTKGENRLIFSEVNRRTLHHVEEVELKQKRPIEINAEDLRHLLSLVEGVNIGDCHPPHMAPHLLVHRFSLDKKKLTERETFSLEMHLIKKEVTQ